MYCKSCGREIPEGQFLCADCEIQEDEFISELPKFRSSNKRVMQSEPEPKSITKLIYPIYVLLTIITIGVVYLSVSEYRETHKPIVLDSVKRVLMVQIDEEIEDEDISDCVQIANAVKNGGMVRINPDKLDSSIAEKVDEYAASDATGNYWVTGAIINYLSSEGWEFEQGPSTGLSSIYYFSR